MAKRAATVFLLVVALMTAPQLFAQSSHAAQIAEANALTDAGKFDEAIAKLQQVLTDDPADKTALFELGLAYAGKGDLKQCGATLAPLGEAAGPLQVAALTMIGNCLDSANDSKAAIATYRRALTIEPDNPEVAFNLGIALTRNGSRDEARELLKKHATADPRHASGHYALAQVFEAQNFRVPALFSYLRFLALEPLTDRAANAAARVRALLDAGVQKTAKGANITIDPSASTAEGDYSAMAMMLALSSAARGTEKEAKLSEFEQVRRQLTSTIAMFTETSAQQSDYTGTVNAPFFAAMTKAKVLDGFAAVALMKLKLPGMQEWSAKHESDVNAFLEWRRPQLKPPSVPIPQTPAPAPAP